MSFNAFRGEEFVRGEFEPASFLWGGDPVQEVLKVLKGSEVSSRAYTRVPVVGVTTGGWKRRRESVGVGRGERRDGSRQALASAGGGTVQSDLRRGASETGTVPTARVCHKEPVPTMRPGALISASHTSCLVATATYRIQAWRTGYRWTRMPRVTASTCKRCLVMVPLTKMPGSRPPSSR